jgi:hypothetical protein
MIVTVTSGSELLLTTAILDELTARRCYLVAQALEGSH